MPLPHLSILRFGEPYKSLDTTDVIDPRSAQPLVTVSQANAGLIRRDLQRVVESRDALEQLSCHDAQNICATAGDLFMNATLPIGHDGHTQSPQQYIEMLSITSGLPHVMCRRNMQKVHTVLTQMPNILRGLTRGLDSAVIDQGVGEQTNIPVSFSATTDVLGVVLPSNSPGVNSIWLPAVALKIPVALKPGREEPWTPMRLVQALVAAGYPQQAFGFYPTDHEGARSIITGCGRSILFGDDATIHQYAGNPNVQAHGTGRSKVIIGSDMVDNWQTLIDVLQSSVLDNSGRSCINTSCIIVPRHGKAIAEALAKRLAKVEPRSANDNQAKLAAFVNAKFADYIDTTIEQGLETPGAVDVTKQFRDGLRRITFNGLTYLRPTLVRCDSMDHPLANTEFLFPFSSVVEMPIAQAIDRIGPTLVATVITNDQDLNHQFLQCSKINRLNLGAIPTSHVEWDQPHEGNLFEFLYHRRAIQRQAV